MTGHAFLAEIQARAETVLDQRLPLADSPPQALHQAMRYAVLGGGKRIRAALVYASGGMLGAARQLLDGPAAAVEMIHAYSLVHDDLPAMDDDDLRRGKPSCHKAFDEATAILAGDALQAEAFLCLTATRRQGLSAPQALAMVETLSTAIGSLGMCGGQALDMAASTAPNEMALVQLEQIHRRKTGALIVASLQLGALCAGLKTAPPALGAFGDALGLAFQITDDILDVSGETEKLGKRAGSDERRGMPTYVTLLGLEGARAQADRAHQAALAALEELADAGLDTADLRNLANYLLTRSA